MNNTLLTYINSLVRRGLRRVCTSCNHCVSVKAVTGFLGPAMPVFQTAHNGRLCPTRFVVRADIRIGVPAADGASANGASRSMDVAEIATMS